MTEQPARYQRSANGLLGAILILLLVIAAFLGLRACSRDNQATPVLAVDYAPLLAQARADHQLLAPAPARMPRGWRATSVRYVPGNNASWHLGILTDKVKYVGIEESRQSQADAVNQFLGSGAVKGRSALIRRLSWQSWSQPGGDAAFTHTTPQGTVFVGGSAGEAVLRDFTGRLSFGTVQAH